MNLILACEIVPPDIGGPATYATQLGEELIKVGHTVRAISYGEVKKEFSFSVTLVSRRIPFFLRQFVYFLKLLFLSKGADVIYAQGPSVGPAAIWVRGLRRTPVVVKFPGDQSWQQLRMSGSRVEFEEYMKGYGKQWYGLKIMFVQWWQKYSVQKADWVVVPSHYLKHVVVDYLGAREPGVVVIPNGVEVKTENLCYQRHCEEITVRQDSYLDEAISGSSHENEIAALPTVARNDILFVGRLENWKGLDVLIDSLKLLPNDFTLTLVGDGSDRKNLELRVTSYELQERVRFIGRTPHNNLEKYFSQALCFYEGSQYEGMPHVVLESWSFGIPVIVSDFVANTELVRDGETGLVFKLGDNQELASKIEKLSNVHDLWGRISHNAFEEHKRYDKNKVMKKTIEFLSTIR